MQLPTFRERPPLGPLFRCGGNTAVPDHPRVIGEGRGGGRGLFCARGWRCRRGGVPEAPGVPGWCRRPRRRPRPRESRWGGAPRVHLVRLASRWPSGVVERELVVQVVVYVGRVDGVAGAPHARLEGLRRDRALPGVPGEGDEVARDVVPAGQLPPDVAVEVPLRCFERGHVLDQESMVAAGEISALLHRTYEFTICTHKVHLELPFRRLGVVHRM